MSDLHVLPLLGHDMPEAEPVWLRQKAHVYPTRDGWRWAHCCAPHWTAEGDFPYMACGSACDGALRHLKECCG